MKKDKTLYLTPEVKILVVRVEGSILTGSVNAQGNTLPSFTEDSILDW